jgi:hypothetical protein
MQLIPNAVPSPLNLINDYLGVCVDCEYKYICPHIREDNCYITVDNNLKMNDKQIAIFRKMIEILKKNSPLCPLILQNKISMSEDGLKLCKGSFEESVEERAGRLNPNDGFMLMVASNDATDKAEVLTSIFYDRIKPFILGKPFNEAFHRSQFAWALECHLAGLMPEAEKELLMPIEKNVRIEINGSEKEGRISQEKYENKPRRNSSPTTTARGNEIKQPTKILASSSDLSSDGKVRKTSPFSGRFNLHLSTADLSHNSGGISPKGSSRISPPYKLNSEKDVLRDALLKLLSFTSLSKCRRSWIDSYVEHKEKELGKHRSNKQNSSMNDTPWDLGEYSLINEHRILAHPMMHQLIQCEFSKDISFGLDPYVLWRDIYRTLDYIDKDHHSGRKAYLRESVLDIKLQNAEYKEGLNAYNADVSCFYYLLKRLLSEIDSKNQKEQDALLNLWTECARNELKACIDSGEFKECIDEAFGTAGEKFFKGIDRENPFNRKAIALITLLRQKFYNHPFQVIHEVTNDVALSYLTKDPNRSMQFDIKDGFVEFRTSLKAIPSVEPEKWVGTIKPFSGCEIELLNIMRSDNTDLSSWNSKIIIKVNVFKGPKNKHSDKVPSDIQQHIIDPLIWVGFDIKVNFVESGVAKSF